jgi:hypothetical protein
MRKRLHWGLSAVGLIFCCACIALAIGISTSPPADSRDLLPFMPGAIFWAVAFGLFPLNWLITARSRTQRVEKPAQPPFDPGNRN